MKTTSKPKFAWVSKDIGILRDAITQGWDWRFLISGADEIERGMMIEALAGQGPFVRIDCREIQPGRLMKEIFGTFRALENGTMIDHGASSSAEGGLLHLDGIEAIGPSDQRTLSHVLDKKEGIREGLSGIEMVPFNFAIISTFRGEMPEEFKSRLIFLLGIHYKIPYLSERPEDLILVLQETMRILRLETNLSLEVDSSFWEQASSRAWPMTLGQWVGGIREFFAKSRNGILTWENFKLSFRKDLDEVGVQLDRLQRKHSMQARDFLIERIYRAPNRDWLLQSLGLSWDQFVAELNKLGLLDDVNICKKLFSLPFEDE